jgi:hypothetical protein
MLLLDGEAIGREERGEFARPLNEVRVDDDDIDCYDREPASQRASRQQRTKENANDTQ